MWEGNYATVKRNLIFTKISLHLKHEIDTIFLNFIASPKLARWYLKNTAQLKGLFTGRRMMPDKCLL